MTNPRKYLPAIPYVIAAAVVAGGVAFADHPADPPPADPTPPVLVRQGPIRHLPIPTDHTGSPVIDRYTMPGDEDDPIDAVGACLLARGHTGRQDGSERRIYAPRREMNYCLTLVDPFAVVPPERSTETTTTET